MANIYIYIVVTGHLKNVLLIKKVKIFVIIMMHSEHMLHVMMGVVMYVLYMYRSTHELIKMVAT